MDQPLAGIRVVEVGGTLAAGAATKTLSDYGADVIKVEPPAGGQIRRLPPFPDDRPHLDRGAYHLALDTGKRSIALDTSTASGGEVLASICAESDLLVLDLPPADSQTVLDRLRDDGPSAVTITPHGLDGPFRGRRESDLSMFAWTTRMQRHSIDGHEPLRYAPYAATIQVGATAAAAGATAIWSRERSGERISIDVAGVEALGGNVDSFFTIWSVIGATLPRAAGPSTVAYVAGNYRCADGYVLFAASAEPFFSRLCTGIGHPELATDPRFATPAAKAEHWEDFRTYLEPWLEARTRDQVFTELQHVGVMVAPVLDVSEVLRDPQAVARKSFVELEQPAAGTTTIAGPPFRLDDAWEARPAPRLGEHCGEILDGLRYSKDEQIALFRAGVTS